MGDWDQSLFLRVLVSPVLAHAAWTTIWVATVAQAIGTAIGLVVGPALLARGLAARALPGLYLWVFRGTPLLAQILFFYAVLPQLGLTLSVVATGLLALGLNEGARMAEIVRSGLLSVPHEQREAARALGLRPVTIFFLVVLPQTLRAILPPLGNNYTYMIKATSLLSTISFVELLRVSQQFAQSTARPLEVYAAAALWYLAIVTSMTALQQGLEHRATRNLRPARVVARVEGAPPPALPATTAGHPLLEARGLRRRLGNVDALDGVDLSLAEGEVLAIVGPSGSGKSTLLRALGGLEALDSGAVSVEGRDADSRPAFGFVFQRFNLFPHLDATDNVALGLVKVAGLSWPEARERAGALLARFGLAERARAMPHALSGGQKQRVAIARALALDPAVLLLDEPTSALDPETVGEVMDVIRMLAANHTTMVIVTHEIGFARAIATRVARMERGRVVAHGSPSEVIRPQVLSKAP